MTRFEEAAQSPMEMSIMVAFCIAGYLEQNEIQFFTKNALKEFLSITAEDIMEWLMRPSVSEQKNGCEKKEELKDGV